MQGAWRCYQAAWFMQTPSLRRAKVPPDPAYCILWEMVRSSEYISIWKSHRGEGLCCYSRRGIWLTSLSTDNCPGTGWESSPSAPPALSFVLRVTLTDPEGDGSHSQRAGWSKAKLEMDPQLWCWLRYSKDTVRDTQKIYIWNRSHVVFFEDV